MRKFIALSIMIIAGLAGYAQTAEHEPNNSFATANYLVKDEVTTGIISSVTDNDFFVTYIPVDGTLKIYVKATNTSSISNYLYFRVYGSNQVELSARYIAGKSSVGAGETVYDTVTFYGRGVDSLFCILQAIGQFSYEVRYAITDTSPNDTGPNNSFAQATPINQNENKAGHIRYILNGLVDDYDYYRAKTSYDGTFKVYVNATNTSGTLSNCYLTVYGGNHGTLAAKYIGGTTLMPAGQTVYDTITLYGRGVDSVFFRFEASGTFAYNFKYDVIETTNNDTEPNDGFISAIPIQQNEIKSGHIKYINNGIVDDYDYYRAKANNDGTLKIYVKATNTSSVSSWIYLSVYGSNKAQLSGKYISGSTNVGFGQTVYDTLTFYGRGIDSVFFRLESSNTFTYSFKYDVFEAPENDAEPNGSFATATFIHQNETKTGHIRYILNGVYDEFDYYRTKTPDDGTLKIYVKATSTGSVASWIYLSVYGSNKAQLGGKYISGSNNIGFGQTVYDTLTFYGRGIDSVYYRIEASGTFLYSFSYEITDKSTNDIEPNGTFATSTSVNRNEDKYGHIKYVLNGIVDDYDYYRTKTSVDGTLKIFASATNTSSTTNWLVITVYAGSTGYVSKYLAGTTSIPAGAKVYDTITLDGIGADSLFIRFEASGTFAYTFRYDITNITLNDIEPNNSFATAIKTELNKLQPGHLMYKTKGIADQNDYYVTPVHTKGNLNVAIELTNISSSPGWVHLYGYNKSKNVVINQYVKNNTNLPAGQLITDTIVLKCAVMDTFYLRLSASNLTDYRFSIGMTDLEPRANMTHERLGNTVGFRPQLANADTYLWDFGDGTTSTQKFPIITYPIGYYTSRLIATNSVCNFKDTAQTVIEVKGVEYFTPDTSGIGGDGIIRIFGGGLDADTKITLKKGATELSPVHLETTKNNVQLYAIFNFHLAEEGTYDVVIEIKGQQPLSYPGGFTLKAFKYPYTWSEIVAPSRIRTNLKTNLKLVVGNKGNVMASGVLVAVIWPKSVKLQFDTKWFKPPASGTYSITADDTTFNFKWEDIQHFYSDTFNTVTGIDTFNLKPYDGFMRLLLIPKIAAGSTVEIPLIVKTTYTGTKEFITYTFKPNLFGSCGSGSWMDASENIAVESCDLLDKAVSATPVLNKSPIKWLVKATKGTTKHMANLGQAMGAFYNYGTGVTNSIYESLPADYYSNVDAGNSQVIGAVLDASVDVMLQKGGENFMKGETDQLNKFISSNPNARDATINFAIKNLNDINDVRNYIKDARTLYKTGKDLKTLNAKLQRLKELLKDCPELQQQLDELQKNIDQDMNIRDPKHTSTSAVNSFDPNEIIGPIGQGTDQYVLKQERQQFTITFENKASALASAQIVTISDTLDASRFDLNSFEFTDFTIGNKTYTVPKGRQEFVLQDSLSPQMKVRINGKSEISTGIVTWQFTSIDPVTGDIPVLEGFLPPNKIMPEGEGSVSFTILPKQTLTDGTVIKNRASVLFDQNDQILTNTWQNVVDALPPSSTVSATRVQGSPKIHLTLSGNDASSGVAYYTVYMQENGENWMAIGNVYTENETIIADSSKQYNFYVLANDKVGNTELKTPGAEAIVGIQELLKGKDRLSLGPNPASDVVYIGGLNQPATFVISDLSGKRVLSGNVSDANNSINIHQLTCGMYIISIYSNGVSETLKLLKSPGY